MTQEHQNIPGPQGLETGGTWGLLQGQRTDDRDEDPRHPVPAASPADRSIPTDRQRDSRALRRRAGTGTTTLLVHLGRALYADPHSARV